MPEKGLWEGDLKPLIRKMVSEPKEMLILADLWMVRKTVHLLKAYGWEVEEGPDYKRQLFDNHRAIWGFLSSALF